MTMSFRRHGVPGLILLGLLTAYVLTSLSHHRYFLTGDNYNIFSQLVSLEKGYFPGNWHALMNTPLPDGSSARHISLSIEGGYPFLLHLARFIHDRAPFMLNALLLPLIPLLLFCLVWMLDDDRERGFLTGVILLAGIVALPLAFANFWELARPFRDTPSHVLGLLGLILALVSSRSEKHRFLWAFLSGLSISLSSWARLTGILFAAPAGGYLLLAGLKGKRTRLMSTLAGFVLGILIGLIPYMVQNVLEGRSLLGLHQSNLVMNDSQAYGKMDGRHHGLHPANFPIMVGATYSSLRESFPAWFHAAALIGLLMWLFRKGALPRMILIGGSLLIYFVFYSCYYTIISRYLEIVSLLYLPFAAAGMAGIIHFVTGRIRPPAVQGLARNLVILGLAACTATLCYSARGNWTQVEAQWRTALRFKKWINSNFKPTDMFISYDMSTRLWIGYFMNDPEFRLTAKGRTQMWPLLPPDNLDTSSYDARLKNGRRVFFISLADPGGREQPSWWKDSILNYYDLRPIDLRFDLHPVRDQDLVPYQLTARPSELNVRVRGAAPQADFLYLYCRRLPNHPRAQSIQIIWPHLEKPIEAMCWSGPNFIRLPTPISDLPSSVSLKSESGISLPADACWFNLFEKTGWSLGLYERINTTLWLLDDPRIWWRGYRYWFRDYGGYPEGGHESIPFFIINTNTLIHLPRFSGATSNRVIVQLYYSAFSDSDEDLVLEISESACRLGAQTVHPTVIYYSKPYHRKGYYGVDFMHEIEVPADQLSKDPSMTLSFNCRSRLNFPENGLVLHHVDYLIEPPPPTPTRARITGRVIPRDWNPYTDYEPWWPNSFLYRPWTGDKIRRLIERTEAGLASTATMYCEGVLFDIWNAYSSIRVIDSRSIESVDSAPGKDLLSSLSRGMPAYWASASPMAGNKSDRTPFETLLQSRGVQWDEVQELKIAESHAPSSLDDRVIRVRRLRQP